MKRKCMTSFSVTKIYVILRAISSRSVINTELLETLCKETSIMFVSHWPTFKFTPSMHQVLAHSTALINANDSTGLGSLSEEPLEHNNKNLRRYRESLARKTTQNANLSDDYGLNLTQSSGVIVMPLSARHVMESQHSILPKETYFTISCQTIEEHLISTIINPQVEQIAESEVDQIEAERLLHQLQD